MSESCTHWFFYVDTDGMAHCQNCPHTWKAA